MHIFGKKNNPDDAIAARLNAFRSQPPAPADAQPPASVPTEEEERRPDEEPTPSPEGLRWEASPAEDSSEVQGTSMAAAPEARREHPAASHLEAPEAIEQADDYGPATNEFTAVAGSTVRAEESRQPSFVPPRPATLEETGLSRSFVSELILRIIYQANELTGAVVAERAALPFEVVGPLLEILRHDQEVEVKGQRGIGDAGYLYGITEKGVRRARESMERITYAGPAPVTLSSYIESVLAQTVRNVVVTQESIRDAFRDLIIDDSVLDMVGPAVNSGSSMFLFGYPGNGKTSIAERITKLMGDSIFIPYAVEIDGAIVTVFDSINHTVYEERREEGSARRRDWDPRWVRIERPVVMVGGELTMASLDLLYNEVGKFYEAPLQMKANGGMFLIDDFGRQMIRPQDLLNRWIVPLEKRVDFLNLVTGKKISIPFEQLIVFSTNLDPKDLVDDAFLRRIKFKINVIDPSEDQFRAIFQLMARRRGVPFDEDMFQYMLDAYYAPSGRPLRMCQPRDIIDQIIAIAKYKMVPAEMSRPLIDRACETYFVSMGA